MSEHSPLPWAAGEYDETGGYDCMYPAIDIKSNNDIIASVDGREYDDISACETPSPEARALLCANAEFIVRACNCHDDLVAALEKIVHMIPYNVSYSREDMGLVARFAIAKAKETVDNTAGVVVESEQVKE